MKLRKRFKIDWPLFLIGLFSMTQIRIVGSIGISELAILFLAPIYFFQDMKLLRRNGVMPVIILCMLTCVSCCISSVINHTIIPAFLRGIASPMVLLASIIVCHRYLNRNLNGLGWILLGVTLSTLISAFVFQRACDVATFGEGADSVDADVIMSGPLFWVTQLKGFLTLPIQACYMQTPFLYSVLAPLSLVVFTFATSESGRSAALTACATVGMLFIARKDVRGMRWISKHIVVIAILGMVGVYAFKAAYQAAAVKGLLTEKARAKYEMQTQGDTSMLRLLMGGRAEFFFAAVMGAKRPIWGYGPWPFDPDHQFNDFLLKYGSEEDRINYYRKVAFRARWGITEEVGILRTHSHLMGFWVWYGLAGLLLWAYVLYRMVRFLSRDIAAVPQWYGYFALIIPNMMWHILFSPFNARIPTAVMIVCLCLASSVTKGTYASPLMLTYPRGAKR